MLGLVCIILSSASNARDHSICMHETTAGAGPLKLPTTVTLLLVCQKQPISSSQAQTKMAACTAPLGAASIRFLFKDHYLWKTKLLAIPFSLDFVKRGKWFHLNPFKLQTLPKAVVVSTWGVFS